MKSPLIVAHFIGALLCVGPFGLGAAGGELKVETNFPGGSAEVEQIDQEERSIRLNPTAHKDRGWDCWWHLKVTGIRPGEVITLDVGKAPWATPDRAAFSEDNATWQQTAEGERSGKRIVYQQAINSDAAWFAWGPPFVPADAERLVRETAEASKFASSFELCRTREDRGVPALRVHQPGVADDERYGIWIQARQHAWESGSSWVCQGFVEWLVSDDPRAEELRKKSLISIVPVMDIDNVAIGAGGKNQVPHDHNRDWSDMPHWRAVEAAIKAIQQQDQSRRFDLFVDLHNPGANSRNPFFYITPRELLTDQGNRNLDRFLMSAREEMTGPLAFVGETQESGKGYDASWKTISKNWVSANTAPHVVAVTLETAWNTPDSHTSGYRTVGRQLGVAIARYLRTNPRNRSSE